MTKISHEGSKSILLFYENLYIQLKHILFLWVFLISMCFNISGFVSYLTFNITVSQVPFFYYVF